MGSGCSGFVDLFFISLVVAAIVIIIGLSIASMIQYNCVDRLVKQPIKYSTAEYSLIIKVQSYLDEIYGDHMGNVKIRVFLPRSELPEQHRKCVQAVEEKLKFPSDECWFYYSSAIDTVFPSYEYSLSMFRNSTLKKTVRLVTSLSYYYYPEGWLRVFVALRGSKNATNIIKISYTREPIAVYKGFWVPLSARASVNVQVYGNKTIYVLLVFNLSRKVDDVFEKERLLFEKAFKGGLVVDVRDDITVKITNITKFLELAENNTVYIGYKKGTFLHGYTCDLAKFYIVKNGVVYVYNGKYPSQCSGDSSIVAVMEFRLHVGGGNEEKGGGEEVDYIELKR